MKRTTAWLALCCVMLAGCSVREYATGAIGDALAGGGGLDRLFGTLREEFPAHRENIFPGYISRP
jgi:hypothetical protein